MEAVNVNSFAISLSSLKTQTQNLYDYLDGNFWVIVYDASPLGLDYKAYSSHYYGLISYTRNLPDGSSFQMMKEKVRTLPEIEPKEFELFTLLEIIPRILFYTILFPLALFYIRRNYIKVSNLQAKIGEINSKLGTLEFLLKASLDYA